MTSWDEEFRNLQIEFLASGPARLAQIDAALTRLGRQEREALGDLKRQTHQLAGSGATYDRPEISDAARVGERLCDQHLAHDSTPSAEDVETWQGMRSRLADAFAEPLPPLAGNQFEVPEPASRREPDLNVLVVDADLEYQEHLRGALEREAVKVSVVASAADALAAIDVGLPDGMIVDLRLPDGNGYDVVQHLRRKPGGESPAALMLGQVDDMFDQVEAIHAGADACYTKPGEVESAIRRMLQLLERTRAEVPRVLVVEDDEHHAAFTRTVLESAGYAVGICSKPREFNERMADFQPELILMDVNLPEVSGYDLARLVRQQEQHTALPIIFLTSEGEMEARILGARAGGDEHLTKPVHPALLASAVGARIERARLLRTLLYRDGLTRLLTHASFIEQVELMVDRRKRGQSAPAALVMLDVDHFKAVNDTHGHQAGDRCLVALASMLRRHMRRTDVIGRYGGEEFGILLEQLDEASATRLMTRLLDEFACTDHTGPAGAAFRCTFSAGVAGLSSAMSRHDWIAAADQALYDAKRTGRARVVLAPPAGP